MTAPLRTCVVADDNAGMREFISRVLSRENFHVVAASNGREAAALIGARPCDLLVTDLAMSEGEGLETILAVRRRFPALKILAISGAFGSDSLLIRVSLPVFVLQTAKVPRVSFHILAAPRPYALDQLPRLAPPP